MNSYHGNQTKTYLTKFVFLKLIRVPLNSLQNFKFLMLRVYEIRGGQRPQGGVIYNSLS